MVSIKYESFDIHSKNESFNKPNVTIVGSPDVTEISISAKDKFGNNKLIQLTLDETGKSWVISKDNS